MKKILLLCIMIIATLAALSQNRLSRQVLDLSNGLVAYYPFNGNANDESGNGLNGIVSGATLSSDRFNQAGKAYNFVYNGFSSDKIQVSGTSDLNFSSGGFSLSAWVKFSGLATAGYNYPIFSKHICGEQSGYILMLYNGKLTFWLAGSGGYNVLGTSDDYTDNSWHQVVAVYDGTTQYIYVDGALKNSAPFIYNTFNSANWALGGYNGCNGGFNGKVDEIKVFNQALTEAEIKSMYDKSANDLLVFLPFNGNAMDESGNGYDGTVYGGILTEDRNNNQNSAYTFPNLHDQIVLANSTNLILQGGFTLNAWVKYKNVNCGIVGKHYCWTPNGFLLGIEDGQFTLWISNGGWQIIKTNETFEENKWYMVSAVYDSVNKTGMLYIDGKLKASGVAIYSNFNAANITISESSGSCPSGNMPGAVDEVKIFNRPLTAPEILSEFYSTQVGLVAFFPFNGNADDASGNQNHGTVHNSVLANDRFGISDKAFLFEGTDSYIQGTNPGNNLPAGNSPRTISAWIKEYSFHPWGNNIFHYGTDQAAPTNFHLYTTDVIRVGNGYDFGVVAGSTPIVDATWHFVAGVYEGGSEHVAKVYVDGKLNNTGNLSSEPNTILGSNWKIGRFMTGSNNFDGKIDDLRIFSSALTDQEIENLYLSETTAPQLLKPEDISVVSGLTPLMEWSNINPDPEYTFELSAEPGFAQTLYQSKTSQPHVQLPEGLIEENVTYFWRVRASLNGETGPWSDTRSFSSVNTGIADLRPNQAKLTITPNPADNSGRITYCIPSSKTGLVMVSVEVINATGKSVRKLVDKKQNPGAYDLELNTKMLPDGVYYIKLLTENGTVTNKMVVVH